MAALQFMEQGSLKSGPYFKHQVWREGANVTQRIAPEDAPAFEDAIANRQKFEALATDFIELTVAHTRQNQFPGSLKKDALCHLAQEEEIAQIMARFASETPTGTAVQALEVLVRTALFKPAAALIGHLLQGAADRTDSQYQPKPGEERKGRESLQIQCLFGTFKLQRDYYHHPGKKSGHYPADAALKLEGSYTPERRNRKRVALRRGLWA